MLTSARQEFNLAEVYRPGFQIGFNPHLYDLYGFFTLFCILLERNNFLSAAIRGWIQHDNIPGDKTDPALGGETLSRAVFQNISSAMREGVITELLQIIRGINADRAKAQNRNLNHLARSPFPRQLPVLADSYPADQTSKSEAGSCYSGVSCSGQ